MAKATEPQEPVAAPKAAAAPPPDPNAPRNYVGPTNPVPMISNLQPCGCSVPADQMTREQQDFYIETTPQNAAWFEE